MVYTTYINHNVPFLKMQMRVMIEGRGLPTRVGESKKPHDEGAGCVRHGIQFNVCLWSVFNLYPFKIEQIINVTIEIIT